MSATNWAELEKSVFGATFVIGTETLGDAVTVNVQLTDRKGLPLNFVAAGIGYLSSDAAGGTPVGIPTSITAGTDGAVITTGTVSSTPAAFYWISEADGDLDIVLTGDTGADTVYINIVLPSGQIVTSDAIVIAAD